MLNIKHANSLEEFHYRNLMLLGWFSIPFVLPFSISCFFRDLYLIGMLSGLLCIALIVNSLCMQYKNILLIHYWVYFILKFMTVMFVVIEIGSIGLFWVYPFIFVVFFVQHRFPARIIAAITFTSFVLLAATMYDQMLVLRFSSTLLLLTVCCDVLVGEMMKMEFKLSELAIRDPLTDAYNRRHMNNFLKTTIEETRRNFGPASIIMMDVDHFKSINDKHGHITGDNVLINLVELLHNRQRKLDYVFRTGGEEFVLLLRNTSEQQALTLAENLRQYVEEAEVLEGQKITVSLGVAEYKLSESIDDWLHRADELMYEAKFNGRNCIRPTLVNEI